MATIRDVASRAGVSAATVSNHLSGAKPVSPAAAQKIDQAIQELHYTMNAAAKNLRRQSSHEVGVVLPNLDDPYYVQLFQGIQKAFSSDQYFVNLSFSNDSPEQETKIMEALSGKQVCGLVLVSCQPDAWRYYYEKFTSRGTPIVLVDRQIKALEASFVCVENAGAIDQMVTALFAEGRQRICLFAGPEGFSCEDRCVQAFRDAHTKQNRSLDEAGILRLPMTKEQSFSGVISLLRAQRPDAILTTSSLLAAGVIEGLRLLGAEEIPVLTLGEAHWNQFTQTFAQFAASRPAIRLGGTAATLLLGQLNSPLRDTEQITLEATCHHTVLFQHHLLEETIAPEEQPTLRILMLENPTVRAFQGLLRNFERETGVRTEVRFLSHHGILQEIQAESPQYDVVMFDIPWLSLLAGTGVLLDISSDVARWDAPPFFPNCLSYFGAFRKGLYGIPFLSTPQMLYYRKDLFEDPALRTQFERASGAALKPPLSLKEYNLIASFFTKNTTAVDYGVSVAAAYNECFAPELYFRLHTFQSSMFDRAGAVTFDNPQTLKAYLSFYHTIQAAKPNCREATDISIIEEFLRGETAMLITYPAFLPNDTRLPRDSASVGHSLVPGRRPLLGGWSFGISRHTMQRDRALSFLRWTCQETISNYFTILGGLTAISDTYTNDEMIKLYPWLPEYYKTYPYTQPQTQPTLPNGQPLPAQQIDDILCKWAYSCLFDHMEISEAITATQQELERLVKSAGV